MAIEYPASKENSRDYCIPYEDEHSRPPNDEDEYVKECIS